MVRANGLSKRYQLGGRESYRLVGDAVRDLVKRSGKRTRREELWALQDISFEIGRGEVVGIIGPNGAGKTTLLKILSRVTEPTAGTAELYGRVGSLLEVGTGFHFELTGRENVFLNGAILGMSKKEIARKLDEIVAFAGVERFMDTPLKFFSSGMAVRLGFAVAAFLEPEVLIVDEVLTVGDLAFQERCLGKMHEVATSGRTVIFVSHNMSAVLSLCPTSMLLTDGRISFSGPSEEAVARYVEASQLQGGDWLENRDRPGTGTVLATSIRLEDEHGNLCPAPRSGDPVRFVLDYEASPGVDLSDIAVNIVISEHGSRGLLSLMSEVAGARFEHAGRRGRIVCDVDRLPLLPGSYNVKYSLLLGSELADKVHQAGTLVVSDGDFYGTGKLPPQAKYYGPVLVSQSWHLDPLGEESPR